MGVIKVGEKSPFDWISPQKIKPPVGVWVWVCFGVDDYKRLVYRGQDWSDNRGNVIAEESILWWGKEKK